MASDNKNEKPHSTLAFHKLELSDAAKLTMHPQEGGGGVVGQLHMGFTGGIVPVRLMVGNIDNLNKRQYCKIVRRLKRGQQTISDREGWKYR